MPGTQVTEYSNLPYIEGGLSGKEVFWRDHYQWLLECGYRLRPRYDPAWIPSWTKSGRLPALCEDWHGLVYKQIIDAVNVEDGASVSLKRISKSLHPYEVDIARYFSGDPLVSDPHNFCVPIFRTLQPPDDDDIVLLVMPLLHRYDAPRFDTFGEAVHFFAQIFQGLQFMHQHHIAHRDCNGNNIMMDAREMFPEGFHPLKHYANPELTGPSKPLTRTQCPPKYYFIDFGIARQYNPANGPPREWPIEGGDKTVPEFKNIKGTYDPFPTDVYYLGNFIREHFMTGHPLVPHIRGRYGFGFMKPLIVDMVQDDPTKRPTMDEVVVRFETIRKGLSSWKLRSRVVDRTDSLIGGVRRSIKHWKRRFRYITTGVSPIPAG